MKLLEYNQQRDEERSAHTEDLVNYVFQQMVDKPNSSIWEINIDGRNMFFWIYYHAKSEHGEGGYTKSRNEILINLPLKDPNQSKYDRLVDQEKTIKNILRHELTHVLSDTGSMGKHYSEREASVLKFVKYHSVYPNNPEEFDAFFMGRGLVKAKKGESFEEYKKRFLSDPITMNYFYKKVNQKYNKKLLTRIYTHWKKVQ